MPTDMEASSGPYTSLVIIIMSLTEDYLRRLLVTWFELLTPVIVIGLVFSRTVCFLLKGVWFDSIFLQFCLCSLSGHSGKEVNEEGLGCEAWSISRIKWMVTNCYVSITGCNLTCALFFSFMGEYISSLKIYLNLKFKAAGLERNIKFEWKRKSLFTNGKRGEDFLKILLKLINYYIFSLS